jgi:hypothetical protein
LAFNIGTQKELDQGHGVWLNRSAIAGQKFAEEFQNEAPAHINTPSDPEVQWMSRGLLDACLRYIDETREGHGLRVAAYEFTYPPVLNALKSALDRGVDVRIVYHDTTTRKGRTVEPGEAEDAIAAAERPRRKPRSKGSGALPAHQDEKPAQQVHCAARCRGYCAGGVDRVDELHRLRVPWGRQTSAGSPVRPSLGREAAARGAVAAPATRSL